MAAVLGIMAAADAVWFCRSSELRDDVALSPSNCSTVQTEPSSWYAALTHKQHLEHSCHMVTTPPYLDPFRILENSEAFGGRASVPVLWRARLLPS
jgi:hypothetical protein